MTIGMYTLDATGDPVPEEDMTRWAIWFEDVENRRIAQTIVGDMTVSTVFLGIDHGIPGHSQLFETLVFGGALDNEMERYATKADALDGHARMVSRCQQEGSMTMDVVTEQRPDGLWMAYIPSMLDERSTFGGGVAYGNTREEAEKRARSMMECAAASYGV